MIRTLILITWILVNESFGGIPMRNGLAFDGTVKITKTGELSLAQQGTYQIAISDGGEFCIAYDSRNMVLSCIDTDTCEVVWKQSISKAGEMETSPVCELAISPDGKIIAITAPTTGYLNFFDAESGDHLLSTDVSTEPFSPKFSLTKKSKTLYFFAGKSGCEILAFDLETEKLQTIVTNSELDSILPLVPSMVKVRSHRDFRVINNKLLLGVNGAIYSIDLSAKKLDWSSTISEAMGVKIIGILDDQKAVVRTFFEPIASLVSLKDGAIVESIKGLPSGQMIIGVNGKSKPIFITQGIVNQPTTLNIYKWDSTLCDNLTVSKTHPSDTHSPLAVNFNGTRVVFIDSQNVLSVFRVEGTEQSDER
jgi:WD40 repeat protein